MRAEAAKKQSQFAGHLQNFNGEHFRSRGYAVYAIGKIRASRNETATAAKPTIASRGATEDNRLGRCLDNLQSVCFLGSQNDSPGGILS